jgi:dethiobiotin synthetase
MHNRSSVGGVLFVAGTDPGSGKTHAACPVIHALRARGLLACGMKPVARGCV